MMASYLRLLPSLQPLQNFLGAVCNPHLDKMAWIDTFIPNYQDEVLAIEATTYASIYE